MGADAGERPGRRALEPLHRRIFTAHAVENGVAVLDLNAEMVEAGGAAGATRIDVEPDIAIAHRHRAAGTGLVGCRHAECGLVELRQLRVIVTDNGNVIDLREHASLLARWAAHGDKMMRPNLPDFRGWGKDVTPPAARLSSAAHRPKASA